MSNRNRLISNLFINEALPASLLGLLIIIGCPVVRCVALKV